MNTSKKLILENLTNITPLSSYPSCNFLDHYVFRDTLSGYSVYYPTTAYGGSFTSSTFNFGVTGGSLNKSCYQDFCFRTIYTRPLRLFCATNLTFVLSALDESVSNIVKIVHYFLSRTTNQWYAVMALGEFYDLNTPGGNFGTSIALKDNLCVVGSPGEMWLDDPTQTYEDNPNTGRTYVFRKTQDGLFTQATILSPSPAIRQSYMQFGNGVGINDDYVTVLSPFDGRYKKSYIDIFDTRCAFDLPPNHLPIPDCSYHMLDGSGFIIDYVNNTYIVSLSC